MPCEFQVLRCFACETFQVHQVKKAQRWECKVCGAKQSFLKAFKIGSSHECRQLVQKLNMEKGLHTETKNQYDQQEDYQHTEFDNNFFQPAKAQALLESDDDEASMEDKNSTKLSSEHIVPGLDLSNDGDNLEIYQPSSLQNALHAFYCATDMKTLHVFEAEKPKESSESKTFTCHSKPPSSLPSEEVKTDLPSAVISRKNKGFTLIQEKAKRIKLACQINDVCRDVDDC